MVAGAANVADAPVSTQETSKIPVVSEATVNDCVRTVGPNVREAGLKIRGEPVGVRTRGPEGAKGSDTTIGIDASPTGTVKAAVVKVMVPKLICGSTSWFGAITKTLLLDVKVTSDVAAELAKGVAEKHASSPPVRVIEAGVKLNRPAAENGVTVTERVVRGATCTVMPVKGTPTVRDAAEIVLETVTGTGVTV